VESNQHAAPRAHGPPLAGSLTHVCVTRIRIATAPADRAHDLRALTWRPECAQARARAQAHTRALRRFRPEFMADRIARIRPVLDCTTHQYAGFDSLRPAGQIWFDLARAPRVRSGRARAGRQAAMARAPCHGRIGVRRARADLMVRKHRDPRAVTTVTIAP
jgi:hypothetical protein